MRCLSSFPVPPAAARACMAAALMMIAAACTDAPTRDQLPGDARSMVIATPPAGFSERLDGLLSSESAATGTPAKPGATTTQLQGDGFLTGWARTWSSGGEDLEVYTVELTDEFHSEDFVRFELQSLAGGQGVTSYPDPSVPQATAFTFFGNTRARSRQVFCQGVWFPVSQWAFEVTDCADTPRYADLMLATARQQYVAAAGRLGQTVAPAVSPS
jgi:hypothetical protein